MASSHIPPSRQLPSPRIPRGLYQPPWLPRHRRRCLIIPVPTPFRYQLKVERTDLAAHASFLPPHGLRLLQFEARSSLWPKEFIQWTLTGRPRGPKVQASRFLQVARMALLEAKNLVARAKEDTALQDRIKNAIRREDLLLRDDVAVAIALVDRSLRPAWKKYGVVPLSKREGDPFKKLLAPDKRSLAKWIAAAPNRERLRTAWLERLIGQEGQTAKDFGLA
jgi:hypothetical protein